jgi:hypothetical protein
MKYLLLIFLTVPCLADSQHYGPQYDSTRTNLEFQNVYRDINSMKVSGSTIALQGLTVSSLTVTNQSQIKGTSTNDTAVAGYIGEYVESLFTGVAPPTTGHTKDATSLSLTAGDWDVTLCGELLGNAAEWWFGISTTSGDSTTGLVLGQNSGDFQGLTVSYICVSSYRMSLASTTTIYAKHYLVYSGTPNVQGRLSARRVR